MADRWLDEPEYEYIRSRIHQTLKLPCPRCGAATDAMCINPDTGIETQSTCFERRTQFDGRITESRTLLYALAIWPTDIVSRATLRAFLPVGTRKLPGPQGRLSAFRRGETMGSTKINRTSDNFQKNLKRFEDAGLLHRGTEFVRIIDRRTLLDRALYQIENPTHEQFLALDLAAEEVGRQIKREVRPRVREVRERELAVIRSLMRPDHYSGRDGSRRNVRHESGEIMVPLGETARRWNPTKNKHR